MSTATFDWDPYKNLENAIKHRVTFLDAQLAFSDPKRIIVEDAAHSADEDRFYCFGKVFGNILIVRFTYRGQIIRIIGAGYWRTGKKIYEQENR